MNDGLDQVPQKVNRNTLQLIKSGFYEGLIVRMSILYHIIGEKKVLNQQQVFGTKGNM